MIDIILIYRKPRNVQLSPGVASFWKKEHARQDINTAP